MHAHSIIIITACLIPWKSAGGGESWGGRPTHEKRQHVGLSVVDRQPHNCVKL